MSLTWYCHLNQYIVTYLLTYLLTYYVQDPREASTASTAASCDVHGQLQWVSVCIPGWTFDWNRAAQGRQWRRHIDLRSFVDRSSVAWHFSCIRHHWPQHFSGSHLFRYRHLWQRSRLAAIIRHWAVPVRRHRCLEVSTNHLCIWRHRVVCSIHCCSPCTSQQLAMSSQHTVWTTINTLTTCS